MNASSFHYFLILLLPVFLVKQDYRIQVQAVDQMTNTKMVLKYYLTNTRENIDSSNDRSTNVILPTIVCLMLSCLLRLG